MHPLCSCYLRILQTPVQGNTDEGPDKWRYDTSNAHWQDSSDSNSNIINENKSSPSQTEPHNYHRRSSKKVTYEDNSTARSVMSLASTDHGGAENASGRETENSPPPPPGFKRRTPSPCLKKSAHPPFQAASWA